MRLPLLASGYYAIFVDNLRIDMRLGVNPDEVSPQPVSIDIAAIVRRIGAGDGIEDVVDYNHLRDDALELCDERHFGLQESYCEALIGRLRARDTIAGVMVETRKLSAFADCAGIGCHMSDIDPDALSR